jgi:hypothetical protein
MAELGHAFRCFARPAMGDCGFRSDSNGRGAFAVLGLRPRQGSIPRFQDAPAPDLALGRAPAPAVWMVCVLMTPSRWVRALRLPSVGVLALVGLGLRCDDEVALFYSAPPAASMSQLRQRITWAVQRGLPRPSAEVNAPLRACGEGLIATRFECKPGQVAPPDGLCSGANRDERGWLACMTWSYADPQAARVQLRTDASIPLTCASIGAAAVGLPWYKVDEDAGKPRWLYRLCRIDGYRALILQHRLARDMQFVPTDIELVSDGYLKFDSQAARLHELYDRQSELGFAVGAPKF